MVLVRIAAVSYLNTIPFLYGIRHAGNDLCAELLLSPPAGCAEALRRNEVDIALLPSAEVPNIPGIHLIGNHCIGAVDAVRTVVLMSDAPMEKIRRIYLDPHSRTSVALARILARESWKIAPEWVAMEGFDGVGSDPEGGYVLIGDKVFGYEGRMAHTWDLSHEWYAMTGLPFAFAVWVARDGVDPETVAALEAALDYGVAHIPEASREDNRVDYATAVDYLTHCIDFTLDAPKRRALELFWKKHREDATKINPG